jgi:hypothetical protein
MAHIRERLPDIKARLNTLMGQTQQELASYGDMHFSGKEHRVRGLLREVRGVLMAAGLFDIAIDDSFR